jgi:hypothetical protein
MNDDLDVVLERASMTEPDKLKGYDFYQGPQSLGDRWTLSRGELTMRCALATHRLGWELRLTAGPSFSRTQICRSDAEVTRTAEAWQSEAKGKGWS